MNAMTCDERLMAGVVSDDDLAAHAADLERQGQDATAVRACLTDLAYRDARAEVMRLWRDVRAPLGCKVTRKALDARVARVRDLLETQTALEIDVAVVIPNLRAELERALPL